MYHFNHFLIVSLVVLEFELPASRLLRQVVYHVSHSPNPILTTVRSPVRWH
jgi:hypothetical protein